jgi:large subunit ribosomal protein L10
MKREDKGKIIQELSQKFAEFNYFYITDASGMTVEDVNKFRKLVYAKGMEYKVVKNSLIKKALESTNTDYTPFYGKVLKGFSGILFANTAGNAPGKLLKEFYATGTDKPVLKGASVDKSLYIGAENLDALATLKSKAELVGDIIGLLQSPAKNVISGLQSGGQKITGVLKTLSEKPE